MITLKALKIAQNIVKSEEWLKSQEETKYKPPPARNTYDLPPVQKADLDFLEPDGEEKPGEDNHQKEKNANEHDLGTF